jgi:MinD superfamily P-loop ATPase
MKEIVVISGKGGTGKTFLVSSLAVIIPNKVILDCDVDAANLYLILKHKVTKEKDFPGVQKPVIDYSKCNKCRLCKKLCRFNAIDEEIVIKEELCEGCGVCALACPQGAITMKDETNGRIYYGDSKYGEFVYARLEIGAENSGKLVSVVREKGRDIAFENKRDFVLTDGPPGIGCPLISSLTGADFALIVTEPTYSGISDMQRVISVCQHFKIRVGIVLNKYDLNLKRAKEVQNFAEYNGFYFLGRIPFSKKVVNAITQSQPYPEIYEDEITGEIKNIWQRLVSIL